MTSRAFPEKGLRRDRARFRAAVLSGTFSAAIKRLEHAFAAWRLRRATRRALLQLHPDDRRDLGLCPEGGPTDAGVAAVSWLVSLLDTSTAPARRRKA